MRIQTKTDATLRNSCRTGGKFKDSQASLNVLQVCTSSLKTAGHGSIELEWIYYRESS